MMLDYINIYGVIQHTAVKIWNMQLIFSTQLNQREAGSTKHIHNNNVYNKEHTLLRVHKIA